ncbi:hypothetical protein [Larkinella terrae]|uniref:Uncharacterized protein n=1 Tax=Larkinella terrae TaxID=2025311 RepID=A0A7K0EFW6_9BACT|nr:hypothetical protein [Larkinella terrae]MRS60328.1 hypothetical protein [Larkinella terrae]
MNSLFLILLSTFLLLAGNLRAQHTVYLTDQTRVEGKITEITDEKVGIQVAKGQSSVKYSYKLDRVQLLFNQTGSYLCPTELGALLPGERSRRITDFMADTSATDPDRPDVILKKSSDLIVARISNENQETIDYQTIDGKTASISKTEVAAVIYRDGRHAVLAEAALLCDHHQLVQQSRQKPSPAGAVTTSAPRNPPVQTDSWSAQAVAILKLSETEYQQYRDRAIRKVEEFATYLGVITDKTLDADTKNKAIDEACKMFRADATIEVSSMTRSGTTNSYGIRDYLTRLKMLPYHTISVQWSNVEYVQELQQRADNNYYGLIKGEQRFSGFGKDGQLQYGDITEKSVEVMLQAYQKQKEGSVQNLWDILLGNIGVSATR